MKKTKNILALLLSVVMILSLLPSVAVADDVVAQIGDTKYTTLSAAILDAADGAIIEILAGTWGEDAVGTLPVASARAKSLTIRPASGADVTFTSTVYLGYDDSKTANASMTVEGLNFQNASLKLVNYAQVTVDRCSFIGSGKNAALYIGDSCDQKHLNDAEITTSQVTVTNCTVNGTVAEASGIRLRNTGNVTLTGNTVKNASHNGILIETDANVINNSNAKTITITGNIITEWNAGNKKDGGRGIRLSLGTLAAGSKVTINDNYFTKDKDRLGLDTPDFAKITGVGSATVDLSHNYWNNLPLSEVKDKPAIYTSEGTVTINSVITYVAQIGNTKYATLEAAVAAANADKNATAANPVVVELLTDVNVSAAIMISNHVTLDGGNHTITTSANRGIRIETSGVTVTVKNLTISGSGMERAIQIDSNKSGITLTIDHVIATATMYTVNICAGTNNLNVKIQDSVLNGWAAINSYASNSTFTITGSTLVGTNNHSSETNDFATIVFDGGTLAGLPGNSASSTLTITDCVIIAKELGTNKQSWISFQYGASNNEAAVVSVSGTSILDDVNGNDKTATIYMTGIGNKITIALTAEQKAALEAQQFVVTENGDKYDVMAPLPEVFYSNGNTQALADANGFDTSLAKPYNSGWMADGEWVTLKKNIVLTSAVTANFAGTGLMNLGEYTLTLGEGGSFVISVGTAIKTDKQIVGVFSAPEGYKVVETVNGDETYTYSVAEITYVARIGDEQYETLAEAIAAVKNNETIVLLADAALSSPVVINNGYSITLDLHGFTTSGSYVDLYHGFLTVTDSAAAGEKGAFGNLVYVNVGADENAAEGAYNNFTLAAGTTMNNNVYVYNNNTAKGYGSKVVIRGTMNGLIFVLGNIHEGNSVVDVYGTINSSDDVGIALNGFATVNVYDGARIEAQDASGKGTGIEVRAGNLNVTGGTIIGHGAPTVVNPNGSGTTSTGAGIAIAQHTTKLPIDVNITGGTISGYSAFYESNPQNNALTDIAKIKLSISGGSFTATDGGTQSIVAFDTATIGGGFISGGLYSTVPDAAYIATGYVAKALTSPEGYYEIVKSTGTAADTTNGEGGTQYGSIPAAVEALVANNDVTEITTGAAAVIGSVTIESGSTIKVAQEADTATSGTVTVTEVTITNGSETSAYAITKTVGNEVQGSTLATTELGNGMDSNANPSKYVANVASMIANEVASIETVDADLEVDLKLDVVADQTNASDNTVTYDVSLQGVFTVNGTPSEAVKIANSDLASGAVFVFRLDVTAIAQAGDTVAATHKSGVINYGTQNYIAQAGANNTVYIEIETSHFSTWDLALVSSSSFVSELMTGLNFNNVAWVGGQNFKMLDTIQHQTYLYIPDSLNASYVTVKLGSGEAVTQYLDDLGKDTTNQFYVVKQTVFAYQMGETIEIKLYDASGDLIPLYLGKYTNESFGLWTMEYDAFTTTVYRYLDGLAASYQNKSGDWYAVWYNFALTTKAYGQAAFTGYSAGPNEPNNN